MKYLLHKFLDKETIFYRIAGVLCIFFQITGYLLTENQHITWSLKNTTFILLASVVFGQLLGALLYFLIFRLTSLISKTHAHTVSLKQLFLLWFIILLCWLPCFLAYFPGICSYDFSIQMGQVETGVYSDHHPFMHTLIIKFFWNLGHALFSSGTAGIAMYTIFQMLLLSGAFTYSLYILNKCKLHKYWIYGLAVFYGLFPVNCFMSISATKDTFFAAFVLFMTASSLYLIRAFITNSSCKYECIVFTLSSIGVIYFRNNGRYAIIVMLAVILLLLIFHRIYLKQYIKILSLSVAALLIAITTLNLTQYAINCTQGDRREMLSIPIQQWARIITRHEQELDEETIFFMKQCINEEGLYSYNPYISDPVKRYTNTSVILNNASTFIRTYIKLFVEYPDEYINAFLIQNDGFLYIFDTSHAWINYNPDISGYGYIQTHELSDELASREIYKTSVLPNLYKVLEHWTNENAYLKIPIINILMAPGIWFSFLLFTLASVLTRKCYHLLVPIAFIIGYYLTLFLGPTVQLRYIYPVMLFTAFSMIFITNLPKTNTTK